MAQTLLPGSVLAMTDQAADRLLRLDSGDAALLYLHFLRHGDLSHLTWSQQRLDTALDQLKKLGMAPEQPPVSAPPVPETPPPEYSLEDITAALKENTSTFPALCDEVEKKMEEAGEQVWHREGYRGDTWIVMDFSGVMVHVFTQEQRKFYDLERLWGDAPMIPLEEYLRPDAE